MGALGKITKKKSTNPSSQKSKSRSLAAKRVGKLALIAMTPLLVTKFFFFASSIGIKTVDTVLDVVDDLQYINVDPQEMTWEVQDFIDNFSNLDWSTVSIKF